MEGTWSSQLAVSQYSEALTGTPGADLVRSALTVARAAVVAVRRKVDTAGVAPGQSRRANPDFAESANADFVVSALSTAGAAVVGIGFKEGACSIAVDGPRYAFVSAQSRYAGDILVDRRRGTLLAATSAVLDVIVEIRTMTAATGLPGRATDVAAARPADAAGVALARPADFETLRLLRLITAFAEGVARVCPLRPGAL